MNKENYAVCAITMIINGKRVSSTISGVNLITDEPLLNCLIRAAHRKVDQLGDKLKNSKDS